MNEYTIEKNIDPVAVVGLCIAVLVALSQLANYFTGPKMSSLPPEQIEIFLDGADSLVITTRMSHVNDGSSSYSGTVLKEYVRFKFENSTTTYQLTWQFFVKYAYSDTDGIIQKIDNSAQPFVLKGQTGVSHETVFYARDVYCSEPKCNIKGGISVAEFKEKLSKSQEKTFVFSLLTDYVKEQTQKTFCKIEITEKFITDIDKLITDKDKSIVSATCISNESTL